MDCKLLNVDAFDYLKTVPDKSFDISITSPPYNMNLRVNSNGKGYCSRQIVKEISTKYNQFSDNLPMEDYFNFLDKSVSELLRVSNLVFFNVQILTGNKPAIFKLLGKYCEQIKELVVWDKGRAQPAIGQGVLNSGFELIIIFSDDAITRAFKNPVFDRGTVSNIWKISPERSIDKNHGAVFPSALVGKILDSFARPGQVVFDPFMGTGTTATECKKRRVSFVGCEINEKYCEAAGLRVGKIIAEDYL